MSFNIRYNNPNDGIFSWDHRKDMVSWTIQTYKPDVLGVQEALKGQLADLASALPAYNWVGQGRDDGNDKGEYVPVFYRKDRFSLLEEGHFWLSETPEVVSKGWDASSTRICSWVQLREKGSDRMLWVFNTHFDHRGEESQIQSAHLVLKKIRELKPEKEAVVLCGDLNNYPDSAPLAVIRKELRDAFEISELPPHASVATFQGFSYDEDPKGRIDYVFVSEGMRIERYGALPDSRDRFFFSDHLPVLVTIK